VVEAGGSRTAAVVLLSQPNGGVIFFQFFFSSVSSCPFLYFGSSPFLFVPSSLWFVLSSVLSFFFLSVFSLSGLLPPFFPSSVLRSIYRAQRAGLFMVAHGEQGLRRLVGHLGAAVEVLLPVFRVGARRVVGQCLRSVVQRRGASGWWPRGERDRFKEEKPFFFLLLHRVQ